MKFRNAHNLASNKGFSLLITLIFVAFFGSVATTFIYNQTGVTLKREAEIAGWQAVKIARAARVFVRDKFAANPALPQTLDIAATGPQVLSIDIIKNAALLPDNFLREEGGEYFNALDQRIVVFMANYPIDGNPSLETTVPTDYIYFEDNEVTNGSLIQDIVQSARKQDLALAAPIFDANGINLSGQCNGLGNAIAIWDSGCMGEVEFTALTGETFREGSLLVPAWRAVNFDSRILMRYPQPELVGMNTMLTELEMGDPIADCETNPNSRISIPSDTGGVTDICGSLSDNQAASDISEADRRRDILNTNNLQGSSYIAYQQGGSDVRVDSAGIQSNSGADETYSFDVANGLVANGDMKAFEGNISVSGTSTLGRNVNVPTRTGQTVTANIGRTLSANGLNSTNLEVLGNYGISAPIGTEVLNVEPSANIPGTLVTEQLDMGTASSSVNVVTRADMLGTTNTDNMVVTGATNTSGYSMIAGNLNLQGAVVSGQTQVQDTIAVRGAANMLRLDVTGTCAGDCPERRLWCIANRGALSFHDCMAQNGW